MRASFPPWKDALMRFAPERCHPMSTATWLIRSTIPARLTHQPRSPATSHLARVTHYLDRNWLRILLLAAIGLIVHVPALQGEFIWDDGYLARENPLIKSPLLLFETFRHYLFLD